ncbi:hypothetical protein K440DRAFT_297346 [Wilcoxina mikolae CBS 423.85]|nr:hypothetical protein K440DRAFT_297346 [Wilcoxina mikolae CBS 423.85]
MARIRNGLCLPPYFLASAWTASTLIDPTSVLAPLYSHRQFSSIPPAGAPAIQNYLVPISTRLEMSYLDNVLQFPSKPTCFILLSIHVNSPSFHWFYVLAVLHNDWLCRGLRRTTCCTHQGESLPA